MARAAVAPLMEAQACTPVPVCQTAQLAMPHEGFWP
jgi:hypothetical protein